MLLEPAHAGREIAIVIIEDFIAVGRADLRFVAAKDAKEDVVNDVGDDNDATEKEDGKEPGVMDVMNDIWRRVYG